MNDNWVKRKIFIVVKTYPNLSRKYQEVVCTAGITDEGEWIRLYPIPFRYLDREIQYEKYSWIETRIKRTNDHRIDSYHPDLDYFKVIEKVSTEHNWHRRKDIIYPTVSQSIEHMQSCYDQEKRSLGIFKPKEIYDLKISKDPTTSRANPVLEIQMSLFQDSPKPLEILPYDFRYHFICDEPTCKGHNMIVLDWEIYEAFRKWRNIYGEQGALDKIKEKWLGQMCARDRDTHFIVGTHNRFPTFMVLGVFYPKIENQLSIFDF